MILLSTWVMAVSHKGLEGAVSRTCQNAVSSLEIHHWLGGQDLVGKINREQQEHFYLEHAIQREILLPHCIHGIVGRYNTVIEPRRLLPVIVVGLHFEPSDGN